MIYRLLVKKKDFTFRTPAFYAVSPADAIAKAIALHPDACEVKILAELSRVTDDWEHEYKY